MASSESEKTVTPTKVNKWDSCAVKIAIDDTIRNIMKDEFGFIEDYKLVDGRLAICCSAVFVALLALVYDYAYPFPISKPVLIFCVTSYFILMAILTFYVTYVEKGIFIVATEHAGDGKNYSTWEASSNLPKYDDMYMLTLTHKVGEDPSRQATVKKSVSNFFTDDGELVKRNVQKMLLKLREGLSKKAE